MYKEIEIKGLVTRRTFIKIDEQTINQIKSVHENKDAEWWEEVDLLTYLFWDAKDKNQFIHVTHKVLTSRQLSIPLKVLQQESLILKHQFSKLKQLLKHTKESMLQFKLRLDLIYCKVISSVMNLT